MKEFEITIPGLNARQRVLADIIWAFETRKEINNFINSLPTEDFKREANNIVELMIMATVEQHYDGLGNMDDAQQLINRITK